jgi:thiol:disulfide interchange protein DsbD
VSGRGAARLWLPAAALAAIALLQVPWEVPGRPAGPELSWRADLEPALAEAAAEGRPAILSFHARWCSTCKRLDRRTLRDPRVARELDRFVRVRVDATAMSPELEGVLARWGVVALPALVLVPADGSRPASALFGFAGVEELLEALRELGEGR